MLNIPYNFLNGFELISKMTRGTFQSPEIRRLAEKSHVCDFSDLQDNVEVAAKFLSKPDVRYFHIARLSNSADDFRS